MLNLQHIHITNIYYVNLFDCTSNIISHKADISMNKMKVKATDLHLICPIPLVVALFDVVAADVSFLRD